MRDELATGSVHERLLDDPAAEAPAALGRINDDRAHKRVVADYLQSAVSDETPPSSKA